MRIAIVDDDTGFIKKVETVIEDYCRKAGEAATVRLFSDGGILLEGPGQERGYDAYILDVEMPRLDGLELARRIREREEDADIIFLSSFAKYALPAYKVRAYDYIMKERYRAEIPAVLDRIRAEKQRRNQEDYYTIQTASMMERLPIDEIRYLTKEKKYVVFYGKEGQMARERTTLEKVYEKLPHERFLYVNKGCIINMKHTFTKDNVFRKVDIFTRETQEIILNYINQKKINCINMRAQEYSYKLNLFNPLDLSLYSPYLDTEIAVFCAALPQYLKNCYCDGQNINKVILRYSMLNKIPHNIVSRYYSANLSYMVQINIIDFFAHHPDYFDSESILVRKGILDLSRIKDITSSKRKLQSNDSISIAVLIEDWLRKECKLHAEIHH